MAFSKKSSSVVMLVVLMLLVKQTRSVVKPGVSFCGSKCYMKCMSVLLSPAFPLCIAGCVVGVCGTGSGTLSHPSFHCGVGCVRSKCSNPGDGNGKVSEECVTSCVNDCNVKFAGHTY